MMGLLRSLLDASPMRTLPRRPGRRAALAVLGALLLSAVAYRLRLAGALRDASSGWAGEPIKPTAVLRQTGADALLAIAVGALVMAAAQLTAAAPHRLARLLRGCGLGLCGLLLIVWGAAGGTLDYSDFFGFGLDFGMAQPQAPLRLPPLSGETPGTGMISTLPTTADLLGSS